MESSSAGSSSRQGKAGAPPFVTIVEADTSSLSCLACSRCERRLPDDPLASPPTCATCSHKSTFFSASSKRLYRLLLSVATSEKVMPVMCFDRAARVLIGCSADELFNFCKSHPFAAEKMGEIGRRNVRDDAVRAEERQRAAPPRRLRRPATHRLPPRHPHSPSSLRRLPPYSSIRSAYVCLFPPT